MSTDKRLEEMRKNDAIEPRRTSNQTEFGVSFEVKILFFNKILCWQVVSMKTKAPWHYFYNQNFQKKFLALKNFMESALIDLDSKRSSCEVIIGLKIRKQSEYDKLNLIVITETTRQRKQPITPPA